MSRNLIAWALAVLFAIGAAVSFAAEQGIRVAFFGVDSTRADLEFVRRAYESAVEAGAQCLRLEVRFKNAAARRLYERLGLSVLAVRRNYYPDDDALIMGVDFGED